VARIDNVEEGKFLVEEGCHVICDGVRLHKNITASCLDVGLKAGIGLVPKRYPLPPKIANDYRFCKACCYSEPNARLHFTELNEEGVAIYGNRQPSVLTRGRTRKSNVKQETSPRKRLRFKQELPEGGFRAVKKEKDDSPERDQSSESFKLGQRLQRRDTGRDWGVGYVTSLDPLEVTAKDDPSGNGYQWDEVRHMPSEVAQQAATMKKPASKYMLGKMQAASAAALKGQRGARGAAASSDAPSKQDARKMHTLFDTFQSKPKVVAVKTEPQAPKASAEIEPAVAQAVEESQRLLGKSQDLNCRIMMALSPVDLSSPVKSHAVTEASLLPIAQPAEPAIAPETKNCHPAIAADSDMVVLIDDDGCPPLVPAADNGVVGIDVE
jgi:hypothetical protein